MDENNKGKKGKVGGIIFIIWFLLIRKLLLKI